MDSTDAIDHVALLAGRRDDGDAVHEVVPARRQQNGLWLVLGTPALAEGCAAGDLLSVSPNGEYVVQRRGGNVALIVYGTTDRPLSDEVEPLRLAFAALGGNAEAPADGRWIVATVPVKAGFERIEAVMNAWQDRTGMQWTYGNVYDELDRPLNWW